MARILSVLLTLSLIPALSPALAAPQAEQSLSIAALDRHDWGWVLAVGGVLAGAAGSSLLIYGETEQTRLSNEPRPTSNHHRLEQDARVLSAEGTAVLGLGVVMLASGVFLWAFGDAAPVHGAVVPTETGGTATVIFEF
jgi:hypothetical protein